MKKLINVVPKISGKTITITAEVAECSDSDFRYPVQQTTIGYNPKNIQWMRHIQISQEAYFVKAFGNGLAIRHEDLVTIANFAEPKSTYPPFFRKQLDGDLSADLYSELDPDFQWQVTDSIKDGEWSNVEGQTYSTLDKSKILKGKFYRLIATSEAGEMASNPVFVK